MSALAVGLATVLGGCAAMAERSDLSKPLEIQSQGSFFIGGETRHATGIPGIPGTGEPTRSGKVVTGQMYVRYQIPAVQKGVPLVLVHGGGLTGQSYETTPDGRMGWADYLVRRGHPVYVVDQVGRGRSGFDGTPYNEVRTGAKAAADAPSVFLVTQDFAWQWFRIGRDVGMPFADTQFPVSAIDAFYKMWIPDLTAMVGTAPQGVALAALAEKIGGAVIVGHSQSFVYPQLAALAKPGAVRGIISIETGFACTTPFTDAQLSSLAKVPTLMAFGDHLDDAGGPNGKRWASALAPCKSLASRLNSLGGDATVLHLPEAGLHGNSHMVMIDKNNLDVADLLLSWVSKHVPNSR